MSKERLEEIAFNVGVSLDGEKALMNSDDYDFLYNYALEQTERVQELEKEIEDWRKEVKKWQRFFREESQQNKRYREAIEGIENAWKLTNDYQEYMNAIHDIIKDLEESK